MKGSFKLIDTDKMQASLTIVMTVEEWKALAAIQPNQWPGWQLASVISKLVRSAEAHFAAEGEAES